MTARICQTCKHYEPSAVWRRGWCRNPRLYAPQQSQLVEQDSLDCSRGLGSAWEAADSAAEQRPLPATDRVSWQPLRLFAPQRLVPVGAGMMASSGLGGGSGGSSSPGPGPGLPRPERPERSVQSAGTERTVTVGTERTVSYQPEERYWTDYLRIALPVAGLLILLGVGWWWAGRIIGGGDDDGGAGTEVALGEVVDTIGASPTAVTATSTAGTVAATSGAPPTATATTRAQAEPSATASAPTPSSTPVPEEETTGEVSDPTREAEGDSREFLTYEPGSMVVTTETVRMRAEGNGDADIVVEEVASGTTLEITGEFVDGGKDEQGMDREDWWPVRDPSTGESGFIREDFLEAQ